MSTDVYSTEMELYGVSPGVVSLFLFIVTIVVPFGFIPFNSGVVGDPWSSYYILYSSVWVLSGGYYFPSTGFLFFSPVNFFLLPLSILNIAYAFWIVRYYQGKSSRYTAITIGVLSTLLPTSLALFASSAFGTFIIIYPIPLQFIAGLIILWRIEGPEVISPWSGIRLDLSWWKWRRPKHKDDWDPFEEEKKASEKEDWLKDE